eukprot:Transcript_10354.p2 GENE.Transcript_10354~~Transcript_10354.p2  ORF type:complete len:332 (-),score=88.68 Transcript_10354:106-1101(-)
MAPLAQAADVLCQEDDHGLAPSSRPSRVRASHRLHEQVRPGRRRRGAAQERRLLREVAQGGGARLPARARLLHGALGAVLDQAGQGAPASGRAGSNSEDPRSLAAGAPPPTPCPLVVDRQQQGRAPSGPAGGLTWAPPLGRRQALAPLGLKWLEEFLPPDDYDGYVEVRRALAGTGVLCTTGEHEYTRYGFRRLIADKAVDILQPDVTWCGGLTEARRVVAQAAAYDIPVIPHGSSVYSYHLQYAFANCPVAELINLSPASDAIVPYFGELFTDEPLPEGGFIDLPDRPGFGVTLNRENLVRPYPRTAEESAKQARANVERPAPKVARMPF